MPLNAAAENHGRLFTGVTSNTEQTCNNVADLFKGRNKMKMIYRTVLVFQTLHIKKPFPISKGMPYILIILSKMCDECTLLKDK